MTKEPKNDTLDFATNHKLIAKNDAQFGYAMLKRGIDLNSNWQQWPLQLEKKNRSSLNELSYLLTNAI